MFVEIAGDDNRIDFEEWTDLCLNKLRMNLDHTELRRVFDQVDKDGSGSIDFEEFSDGIKHFGFLRSVAKALAATKSISFRVPENYDFSKPTSENYKTNSSVGFANMFADIRSTRDYTYHTHYTMERQNWQDAVVSTIAVRNHPQVLPWVVFTCGGMGAGKGYVLSWMSQHGFFPLEQIVHVDPDHFKSIMPEWDKYVATNMNGAGGLCQRESGFLAEIAQEVAMRNRQHLWIDGSLRDGAWYATVFDDLRIRYPDYRIAIFYIRASEDIVRERVAKRAAETGRDVPESLIIESLSAPNDTLARLVSKADFLARINNDSYPPKLEAFEVIDRSGSFSLIRNQFAAAQPPPNRFPQSLAPLTLRPCAENMSCHVSAQSHSSLVVSKFIFDEFPSLKPLQSELCDGDNGRRGWIVHCGPKYAVTVGQKGREEVMIPIEARAFAWIYPSAAPRQHTKVASRSQIRRPNSNAQSEAFVDPFDEVALDDISGLDKCDPIVCLALNGGFVYFDASDKVVRVNAIMGFTVDWKIRNQNISAASSSSSSTSHNQAQKEALLQFEPAEHVPDTVTKALRSQGRLVPVTWHRIRECTGMDMLEMGWINPCEKLGSKKYTNYGGFVFVVPEGDQSKRGPGTKFPVLFALTSP
eukprot:c11801_g2_i2.p1 GENE.c11801_g2_i2~~c11801_g2_i2.p1  ORF type:complete len:641 (-),score=130.81 c11801_g2_i2:98-2020(-)